jgi:hypothetical protein
MTIKVSRKFVRGGNLALPLLVAGIGANDVNPALAAHDFAIFANLPHAGTHFHDNHPKFR